MSAAPAPQPAQGILKALSSYRWTFFALVILRLIGTASGIAAAPLWIPGPMPHSNPVPASSIFAGNLRGALLIGAGSVCTGGLVVALFMLIDGFRYGLSLAVGRHPSPAGLAFPWLEFVTVALVGAIATSLFWRLWSGLPLPGWRRSVATGLAAVLMLGTGAEVEASLLQ